MIITFSGAQSRLAAMTRRAVGEPVLALASWRSRGGGTTGDPQSIFVLRNNDLGDVLIITPLFEALRRGFPTARIVAGVGHWSVDLLRGNPHLSDVMVVDAPWFNKVLRPQGLWAELSYLCASDDIALLRSQRFDVGIDVLGSAAGAALLLRAGVPRRLGVRGYAGGHSSAHQVVSFDPHEHVGRSALRFAELLGVASSDLPTNRPQLFLDTHEREFGRRRWAEIARDGQVRVIVGPGTGDPRKGWPLESFKRAVRALTVAGDVAVIVVGGPGDRSAGDDLAANGRTVVSVAGQCTLRQTFALVAACDAVITNASMLMHAAAAFSRPTAVVLGPAFSSARLHDEQWGYAGTCLSLGPEPGSHPGLATPGEAVEYIRSARFLGTSVDLARFGQAIDQ